MTANEGREQFIERYTEGRGSTELNSRGRYAIPCECGENGCSGWQMAHPRSVENFLASIPAVPAATKELIDRVKRDFPDFGLNSQGRQTRDDVLAALEALTGEQE